MFLTAEDAAMIEQGLRKEVLSLIGRIADCNYRKEIRFKTEEEYIDALTRLQEEKAAYERLRYRVALYRSRFK
jgi:hypothetical protein